MNWWTKTKEFLSETRTEMRKVSFPTRDEVMGTTIVVLVTSVIFGIYLFAADRLIVSGVRPKERKDGADPRPDNCWHRIVEQAMAGMGALTGAGHLALRYGSPGTVKSKCKLASRARVTACTRLIPGIRTARLVPFISTCDLRLAT